MFRKTSDVSDATVKQPEPFLAERKGLFIEQLRMKALNAPARLTAGDADLVKLKLIAPSYERVENPISTSQINPAINEICSLLQHNQRNILLSPIDETRSLLFLSSPQKAKVKIVS